MFSDRLDNLLHAKRPVEMLVAFSETKKIVWQAFVHDVASLTMYLKQQKETRWAICCDDSYLFCIAFFALAYADKKIVLPGNHQPEMLNSLSAEFDAIITDVQLSPDYINQCVKKKLYLPLADKPLPSALSKLDLSQRSITLFTSGSTGQPKTIIKTLDLLDNEIQQLQQNWGELLSNKQIVSTVSHQHIYGLLFRVLWPLCAGSAFACTDLTYPEQVSNNALPEQVLISSPALLKRLTETTDCKGYAAVFSSGGPLTYSAVSNSITHLKQLPIEVFGSTETGGIGYRQQTQENSPWSFFKGITADINDETCLKVVSPWIADIEGYQTADQCQLLEQQQFILKGRIDKIVKIEEKRISLIEVEQHLTALSWVDESAVLLLSGKQRASLGAVLSLSEQGVNKLNKIGKGKFWILLRQQLRLWIEPVAIPRYFRVLNEIPVNKQGKRSHSELVKLFTE